MSPCGRALEAISEEEGNKVIEQLKIKLPKTQAAAPVDWMAEARKVADQESATVLMETAKQAGLSTLRLNALKGAIQAKGFTV